MRRLLRTEPTVITGLVTAILAVAVSFGLGLDAGQIAAIVALIGAAFAFVRGMVWPANAVATIVADTATTTAIALDHVTAGAAGELTDAGQAVVGRVIRTVTGGRYSPLAPASGGSDEGREDGGIPLAALIALVVALLVLAGGFAVCDALIDDQDEPNDLGAPALVANHEDRDGDEYDQRYGNEGDQSRCRGRGCRGSFSPGPFDRSPIDFSGSCFSLDCSGHERERRRDRDAPE